MWDQVTVTSNRECGGATELHAKIDMHVSRVQPVLARNFIHL